MVRSKLERGKNDLATLYPELAKQAHGWDPSDVTPGSKKKVEWICQDYGHIFLSIIKNRTSKNTGCGICAGSQLLSGFNDLATRYPEIAAQADGWDPSTVFPGSHSNKNWLCDLGHSYVATINNRTNHGNGCPYCTNKKVLTGFNDVKTKYPEIANEAYGWDPSKVCHGTNEFKDWKCELGHTWSARVHVRTMQRTGCPYCAGRKVWIGFNDLQTTYPQVAKQADGWDPKQYTSGAKDSMDWLCEKNHAYKAPIQERTGKGRGCPYCANKKLLKGFNDLASCYPKIAAEADGWDPSEFVFGSKKRMNWRCQLGHTFTGLIINRTQGESSCPICMNHQLLIGFNDLATKYPDLAKEAYGWDPSKVLTGSAARKRWICSKGHKWNAQISNRCNGSGCPTCSEGGFDPSKEAWLYLMERPGEQQFGISNVIKQRLEQHHKNGWVEIDLVGPFSGELVFKTESLLKKWLKSTYGNIKGTSENWSTINLEVKSLTELKKVSGIPTDLF